VAEMYKGCLRSFDMRQHNQAHLLSQSKSKSNMTFIACVDQPIDQCCVAHLIIRSTPTHTRLKIKESQYLAIVVLLFGAGLA